MKYHLSFLRMEVSSSNTVLLSKIEIAIKAKNPVVGPTG